ncbi:hypothetical protein JXM83_01265 [Candidatus Woesearchaeota archaeon]|nr:hypothetical protein [Candidatus Woesearchaeota archaeon]
MGKGFLFVTGLILGILMVLGGCFFFYTHYYILLCGDNVYNFDDSEFVDDSGSTYFAVRIVTDLLYDRDNLSAEVLQPYSFVKIVPNMLKSVTKKDDSYDYYYFTTVTDSQLLVHFNIEDSSIHFEGEVPISATLSMSPISVVVQEDRQDVVHKITEFLLVVKDKGVIEKIYGPRYREIVANDFRTFVSDLENKYSKISTE